MPQLATRRGSEWRRSGSRSAQIIAAIEGHGRVATLAGHEEGLEALEEATRRAVPAPLNLRFVNDPGDFENDPELMARRQAYIEPAGNGYSLIQACRAQGTAPHEIPLTPVARAGVLLLQLSTCFAAARRALGD
jgi:hypothetical protein